MSLPPRLTDLPAERSASGTGLIAQRYGRAGAAPAAWNETLATLVAHRSVRRFVGDPLPDGVLDLLIAAASSAPTSSNLQAWSVVAVSDPRRKRRLAELASLPEHGGVQQHIVDAPLLLVWVADLSRAERIAGRAAAALESIEYLDNFIVAAMDAALAAQNALVAAESLGLGTVYIGAMRNQAAQVAEVLGLPPRSFALAGLVVGFADPAVVTAIKPRLPPEVVLHHEVYDAGQDGDLTAYDAATEAFRAAQGLPAQSWTQLVLARLGRLAVLHGREHLRDRLARLGLPLR